MTALSLLAAVSLLGLSAPDETAAADAGTPPETVAPAPAAAAPVKTVMPGHDSSILKEDLNPTIHLLDTENFEMRVGGLVHVQAALYTGPDALIANGDMASNAGFRLRRARLGLEGRLGKSLGVLLAVNLVPDDASVGAISDAKLTYAFAPWLNVAVGTSKVPFSRSQLQSSRLLLGLERPMSVGMITPTHRLGASFEGHFFDDALTYVAAIMNGTEGFPLGNQFGGVLAGGRLEWTPWGHPEPATADSKGLSVGASYLHDEGPGVRKDAVNGDALFAIAGFSLQVEVNYDRATPTAAPSVLSGFNAWTERIGGYVEGGYAFELFTLPWQVTARGELVDDNIALKDSGDVIIVSGGLNCEVLKGYARAQLQYVWRKERFGVERLNDVLALSVQGSF